MIQILQSYTVLAIRNVTLTDRRCHRGTCGTWLVVELKDSSNAISSGSRAGEDTSTWKSKQKHQINTLQNAANITGFIGFISFISFISSISFISFISFTRFRLLSKSGEVMLRTRKICFLFEATNATSHQLTPLQLLDSHGTILPRVAATHKDPHLHRPPERFTVSAKKTACETAKRTIPHVLS
jgi:hypothetical protein